MTFNAYASETDPPIAYVNPWTDARVDRLKVLYAEGLSCSQIAAELLHISRNGVIGKVHRLGLERRGRNSNYQINPGSKPGPKYHTARPKRDPRPYTPRPRVTHESPEIKAMRCAEVVPLNIAIGQLTESTCKWPYGDGPWTFCGHAPVKGLPYCSSHQALAHKPTKGLSA